MPTSLGVKKQKHPLKLPFLMFNVEKDSSVKSTNVQGLQWKRTGPWSLLSLYPLFPFQRSCFLARQPAGVLLSAVVRIPNTTDVSEGKPNTWCREKVDEMLR